MESADLIQSVKLSITVQFAVVNLDTPETHSLDAILYLVSILLMILLF